MNRKKKKNLIRQGGDRALIAWLNLLFECFLMVIFARKMGLRGLDYFCLPALFYLVPVTLIGETGCRIISGRVRFYAGRDDFRGARRSYHQLMMFCVSITFVYGGLMALLADKICQLMGMALSSVSLRVIMAAALVRVVVLCIEGFLEGMNISAVSYIVDSVSGIVSFVFAFFLSSNFSEYGAKVAALVRVDDWLYAYMAAWGAAALLAGHVASLLVMMFFNSYMTRALTNMFEGGGVRRPKKFSGELSVFGSVWTTLAVQPAYTLALLILFACVGMVGNVKDPAYGFAPGLFLLAVFCLLRAPILLEKQITGTLPRGVLQYMKHGDHVRVRERIAICLKVYTYYLFPLVTAFLAMAPSIGLALFDTEAETFAKLIRGGVWMALLLTLGLFLYEVCVPVCGKMLSNLMLLLSFLVTSGMIVHHMRSAVSQVTDLAATVPLSEDPAAASAAATATAAATTSAITAAEITPAFWLPFMVGGGLLLVLGAISLYQKIRYKDDLLRIFLLTGISCVVFGLVAFVFERFTAESLGCYAVLLMGGGFGGLAYIICILMTHTFDLFEWHEVPGKGLPLALSRFLKLY